MKLEWNEVLRGELRCAVTGHLFRAIDRFTGVLNVGHIISINSRPDLAQVESNVAPITQQVNERMNPSSQAFSKEFLLEAQERMREWARIYEEKKKVYLILKGSTDSGIPMEYPGED